MQRRQSGLKSGESWIRVKNFDFFQAISQTKDRFSGQISEKCRFFTGIFKRTSLFQGKFPKNFNFLGNFTKTFDFIGKNWLFTAIPGQIILFLFKIHHF